MKRKMLLILPALLLGHCMAMVAQEKIDVSATNTYPQSDESGRFWIYWADFDEWGHAPDCSGWGLCNYTDCWMCDINDKHRAKVLIDKKSKTGEMLIELNPEKPEEKKAIHNKSVFIVSSNIYNNNSTLYKGNYNFDASIGKYGGYRLQISLK